MSAYRNLLCGVCMCVTPALAITRYVDVNSATPAAPYTSWATAAQSIQAAVDVCVSGDEVVVANGVYAVGGTLLEGVSNRIALHTPVQVRSLNGPTSTVICGVAYDYMAAVGMRCAYLTNGAELHGMTLSNGSSYSTATSYPMRHGGGALLTGGGMLSNCVVADNQGVGYARGGGVYCHAGGRVFDSLVMSNSAYMGGGVFCCSSGLIARCALLGNRSLSTTSSDGGGCFLDGGHVRDCLITENEAYGSGGGVFIAAYSLLMNCLITSNRALYTTSGGGGVHLYLNGLVSNCIVSANRAELGGGIYNRRRGECIGCALRGNEALRGGGYYAPDGGTLRDSLIANNRAMNGAGVYANASSATIALCRISANVATNNGGGVYCASGASLFSCLIARNEAGHVAGGLYLSGGTVCNCTISSNMAASGGGVHINSGTVLNGIIHGNSAASQANWSVGAGTPVVLYSATTPTNNLPDGRGCIADEPVFADSTDFRLLEGSPCINAGTNLVWMAGASDLDGNPRIHGSRVDMGCYEFVPEPCIALLLLGLSALLARRTGP